MKKSLVFILGVITGVFLTITLSLILTGASSRAGISFYDAPEPPMPYRTVEVFQAISAGTALCHPGNSSDIDDIVLLWTKERVGFYDGQTISVQTGYYFRQVGVYRYQTGGGLVRTVPVIAIMNSREKSIPK